MKFTTKFLVFLIVVYFAILGSLVYGQSVSVTGPQRITIETPTGITNFGSYDVKYEEMTSDNSIHYFTLSSPLGSAVISVDKKTPLGQFLHEVDKQRVRLTLEQLRVEQLEGLKR